MPLQDWQLPQSGYTTPSLNFSSLYNPSAYGSIPQIPATTTNQTNTNQLNTGQTSTLADMLNTTNTSEQSNTTGYSNTQTVQDAIRNIMTNQHDVSSWVPNIPGYEGLANASSEDVSNWLAGRLDPEALADAATWAAQRGVSTGVGMGSPNAAAAYQHFLGLSRQSMQERGLAAYLQLLAQSPRTTTHDVSGSTTETGRTTTNASTQMGSTTNRTLETIARQTGLTVQDVANTMTGGTTQIQDNNILQAMYAAAPDPYRAAMANMSAQGMGAGAGAAAGGGISFPRASTYSRPDTYSTPYTSPTSGFPGGGGSFGGYGSTPQYSGGSFGGYGQGAFNPSYPAAIGMADSWNNQAHNEAGISYGGIQTPGPYGMMQLQPQDEGPSGAYGYSSYDQSPWYAGYGDSSGWSDADIDAEIASWIGE